jgi:hypothetical protein
LFYAVEHFPRRPPIESPGDLPSNIERLYLRAEQCFRRGDMDGASMLIRKTLEVALKEKFGDLPGNLFQRIQYLNKEHFLTDDLAQWANEIRIDGNKAVHESAEPDRENTRQMKEFLYVFLLYTFTLPKMIDKKRHSLTPGSS